MKREIAIWSLSIVIALITVVVLNVIAVNVLGLPYWTPNLIVVVAIAVYFGRYHD